jgi:hypothetical protein
MCSYYYEYIFIAYDVQTSGKMRYMWYIHLPLAFNGAPACLIICFK